jgi:hypothetical protein
MDRPMTYQDPRDIEISPNVWLVRLDLSEQKETGMISSDQTATTEIGTWVTLGRASSTTTLTEYVSGTLAEFADDYDVPAIVAEYRDMINSALPDGVTLHGEDYFVGPYRPDGWKPEELEAVRAAIADVPLWGIIDRHHRCDTGQDSQDTSERPEDAARRMATELIKERATVADLRRVLTRLMAAANGRDVADAAYRIELRMAGEDAITMRRSDLLYGQARVAAARTIRQQAHDEYMQAIEEVKALMPADRPV